ncbi:hypothetical protein N9X06_03120 [Paracoccaceae bacterium]|nr:hypothetical protein [Paracoccaceae bacterium]
MTARKNSRKKLGLRKRRRNENKQKGKKMTGYLWGLLWSIELRFGIGLDVESVESRPVWTVKDGELNTMPFSGLVIQIPFFTISIGNVYEEVDA